LKKLALSRLDGGTARGRWKLLQCPNEVRCPPSVRRPSAGLEVRTWARSCRSRPPCGSAVGALATPARLSAPGRWKGALQQPPLLVPELAAAASFQGLSTAPGLLRAPRLLLLRLPPAAAALKQTLFAWTDPLFIGGRRPKIGGIGFASLGGGGTRFASWTASWCPTRTATVVPPRVINNELIFRHISDSAWRNNYYMD
jgi:hypothetical protein